MFTKKLYQNALDFHTANKRLQKQALQQSVSEFISIYDNYLRKEFETASLNGQYKYVFNWCKDEKFIHHKTVSTQDNYITIIDEWISTNEDLAGMQYRIYDNTCHDNNFNVTFKWMYPHEVCIDPNVLPFRD